MWTPNCVLYYIITYFMLKNIPISILLETNNMVLGAIICFAKWVVCHVFPAVQNTPMQVCLDLYRQTRMSLILDK